MPKKKRVPTPYLIIRCSAAHRSQLHKAAKRVGKSMAAYVRDRLGLKGALT